MGLNYLKGKLSQYYLHQIQDYFLSDSTDSTCLSQQADFLKAQNYLSGAKNNTKSMKFNPGNYGGTQTLPACIKTAAPQVYTCSKLEL